MPRKQAESGPQAHAITRWLGIDAPDLTPRVGHLVVDRPGWLLVCSDGLWNYASEPAALAALVRAAATTDPAVLALALTDFANASGGQDNITTALARVGPGRMPLSPRTRPRRPPRHPCRPREDPMAEFTAAVYQNEYLPDGGTDVNAIVTVTCAGAGAAGQAGSGSAGEIIIVDTSGSMGPTRMAAARDAAKAALGEVLDGTLFAVVAGSDRAALAYPRVSSGPGLVRIDPQTRATPPGRRPVRGQRRHRHEHLADLAVTLFASVPEVSQRHAILLTDGENREDEGKLDAAIRRATGVFQCDCRGRGTDWVVPEVRRISQALLGSVDIIPSPDQLQAQFREIMQTSMARGVADAQLRVWSPQGAQVLFVRQVAPTVEDLTDRRTEVNALIGAYPTGAWADESRDYHVAVRVAAKAIGQEQLAARVQLALGDDGSARGW